MLKVLILISSLQSKLFIDSYIFYRALSNQWNLVENQLTFNVKDYI